VRINDERESNTGSVGYVEGKKWPQGNLRGRFHERCKSAKGKKGGFKWGFVSVMLGRRLEHKVRPA